MTTLQTISKTGLGRSFEGAVADWLGRQGYTLLARNFTVRGGELDLVMRQGDVVAFVEVKARKAGANLERYGRPSAAVNPQKRAHLLQTADCWIRTHPLTGVHYRMDVVEVFYELSDEFYLLRYHHIRSAFTK